MFGLLIKERGKNDSLAFYVNEKKAWMGEAESVCQVYWLNFEVGSF